MLLKLLKHHTGAMTWYMVNDYMFESWYCCRKSCKRFLIGAHENKSWRQIWTRSKNRVFL